jgi:hypothetical protein
MIWVQSPSRAGNLSLLCSVQTEFEVFPASYPIGTGSVSPGLKRPEREADHSPPSDAEIKNGEVILPLPINLHDVVLN